MTAALNCLEVRSERTARTKSSTITLPEPVGRRICLLYTSDAADERSSVDLGGRRIINKKKKKATTACGTIFETISALSSLITLTNQC